MEGLLQIYQLNMEILSIQVAQENWSIDGAKRRLYLSPGEMAVQELVEPPGTH